jgi:putative ABC transport system ATP-binding protein
MSGAHDNVIETRNLTRIYKQGKVEVPALRGVDLTVGRGEFTALAGPSGSGKTTLLNMIGCLDAPTSGEVRVEGKPVSGLSRGAAARFRLGHIGFVFQAYNLIPVLTAYENAEFILLLQGLGKAERRERVVPLLERVGLEGMLGRRPHELSGGQQQRVAVVRAIAPRPAIVLADEPTANLDSETSEQLIQLMLELNLEHGVTFLFSSHEPIVMERARRLVMLKDGYIESDDVRTAS